MIIPSQKKYFLPNLSDKVGNQRRVHIQPRNTDEPIMLTLKSETHVRSSLCCQLSSVCESLGSASQVAILGSLSQMFSKVQMSSLDGVL